MSDKIINRSVALGVFLIAAIVYLKTLSVTVVFWDVGEFCASSFLLQVPHPPGSPLFLIVARVVSMVPFLADIAARMHAISAFGSAIGVMFLYLVAVKLILRFRGPAVNLFEKLVVYGSSAVGALTLAFTTTYWDNAIEAEVYGLSMFFVAVIMWLALRWWERADEPHNEKYILLIAYLIGLSSGVHLLSLLAVFSVLMIIYFRRYEFSRESFIKFGLIGVGIFFLIYPGVVQFLPSMLDGDVKFPIFGQVKSEILPFIPPIILIIVSYYTIKSYRTKQKTLHIACLSFLLIVLGYTTYTMVIIRANVPNMPMNENNPSNLERLVSYLSREQYGDTPLLKGESWDNDLQDYREKLFPRRHSREAMHEPTRVNYTSDGDFLWRWQINHMFLRYVGWNFIGAEGDWQDAGVSWKDTWGIPLLIGLFGLYYHFKRDWKMGLTFFALFFIMGLVLDLYQNQQEPQPRERDYFYVGAYYVVSIWIAIGLTGLIEMVANLVKQIQARQMVATGMLAVAAVALPFNLARINWFEHDRSQIDVAWDYSYNLLQSCEPNSILFTNGDNDTFPLWYLQDVEGVRRDVRIVNLSLVNTNWYIHQLKNGMPHGAEKVPISLSDQQIERISPVQWKSQVRDIPVPPEVAQQFGVTDTAVLNNKKITFTMNGIPFQQDIKILRVQDIMVYDIIRTNNWQRPVFFAVTCSPDSKIGLDNYLWMYGLTYKMTPVNSQSEQGGLVDSIMTPNVMAENVVPSKTYQHGYLYRNLNNKNVYYDENVQRLVMNYRVNFMRLADYAERYERNRDKAKKIMARMEDVLPIGVLPIRDWRFSAQIMEIYRGLDDMDRFEIYAKDIEPKAIEVLNSGRPDLTDYYNPYRPLLTIYDTRKNYAAAIDLLNRAAVQYPRDPNLRAQIQRYEQLMKQGGGSPDTNASKIN